MALFGRAQLEDDEKAEKNVAPVAYADNPRIPVQINADGDNPSLQKKKILIRDATLLQKIGGVFSSLARSALFMLPKRSLSFSSSSGLRSALEDSETVSEAFSLHQIKEPQEILHSAPYADTLSSLEPDSPLSAIEIDENFSPYTAHPSTKENFYPNKNLSSEFEEKFNKLKKRRPYPANFVPQGVRSAKKHLLNNALLVRAYTSTAAHSTIQAYDNTVRSSKLLENLVKKGLITSATAAKELSLLIKNTGRKLLSAGPAESKAPPSTSSKHPSTPPTASWTVQDTPPRHLSACSRARKSSRGSFPRPSRTPHWKETR